MTVTFYVTRQVVIPQQFSFEIPQGNNARLTHSFPLRDDVERHVGFSRQSRWTVSTRKAPTPSGMQRNCCGMTERGMLGCNGHPECKSGLVHPHPWRGMCNGARCVFARATYKLLPLSVSQLLVLVLTIRTSFFMLLTTRNISLHFFM